MALIDFFSYGASNTSSYSGKASVDWPMVLNINDKQRRIKNMKDRYTSLFGILDSSVSSCSNTTGYIYLKEVIRYIDTVYHDISIENRVLNTIEQGRIPYDPVYYSKYGVFAKAISFLDSNSKDFMTYYAMAKQLKKYFCNIMSLYRFSTKISTGLKSGYVMSYFDEKFNSFYSYFDKLYQFITSGSHACDKISNANAAYYHGFSYNGVTYNTPSTILSSYQNDIRKGFLDLNTVLEAFSSFYEDLDIAVRVIAAVNLALFADPEDHDTLKENASSNFSFLTLDTSISSSNIPSDQSDDISPQAAEKRRKILQAVSVAVTTAINYKQFIKDDMSNLSEVNFQATKAIFDYLGISKRFDDEYTLLQTQSPLSI